MRLPLGLFLLSVICLVVAWEPPMVTKDFPCSLPENDPNYHLIQQWIHGSWLNQYYVEARIKYTEHSLAPFLRVAAWTASPEEYAPFLAELTSEEEDDLLPEMVRGFLEGRNYPLFEYFIEHYHDQISSNPLISKYIAAEVYRARSAYILEASFD